MIKTQQIQAFFAHLSKRERAILYAVIGVIAILLLDRLIINPIASKLRSLDKEIADQEVNTKKNMRILAQKDRIAAEGAKYSSFLAGSQSEEEEVTDILKAIENLASKNSIYLVDMKPSGMKNMGISKKYTVNLNCEAQMEQLANFMYDIESSNRLLTIEKYQITPKARESSVAKCSMSIARVVLP